MKSIYCCKGFGALLGALLIVACGSGQPVPPDARTSDAALAPDTGTPDATMTDAAPPDAATPDAAPPDAAPPDAVPPDACVPTTCWAQGKDCGIILDGCGAELDCGGCDAPETCGGGGIENVCGRPCVPVRAMFFDLGDTLVQSNGNGRFVERPGAVDTIAGLKALGMRVGVITNTPPGFTLQDLQNLLVNPSFLNEFEVVLLSSLASSPPKPDPAIFAEAHSLLTNAPPIQQVAHVSENLAEIANAEVAPTRGARAAGMVGVHLSAAPPSPFANYTIAPDQLPALVTLAQTEWLTCTTSP